MKLKNYEIENSAIRQVIDKSVMKTIEDNIVLSPERLAINATLKAYEKIG